MVEDSELLRRYVFERSQKAFAELVERRLNLVYSVALRQVGGNRQLAEDVTQQVFIALARKASQLAQRPVLTGWLYRSAQYAASDIVRAERRRRQREQETESMQPTISSPDTAVDWDRVRPMLDEVMSELNDADRDALALRFFEEQPFAEIGRRLGLQEDAARKRVTRALDKMHGLLMKRGISSTGTAALAVALGQQAAIAAPAGLAASIASSAAAAGAAVSVGVGLWATLAASKAVIGTSGAITLLAVGTAVHQVRKAQQMETTVVALEQTRQDLSSTVNALTSEVNGARQLAGAAETDLSLLLEAMERPGDPPDPPAESSEPPLTTEAVRARYQQAQEMVRQGDYAGALVGFLWCYDEGMLRASGLSAVRLSFLTSDLGRLAQNYPPALDALRVRQGLAERTLQAGQASLRAAQEFAALNAVLNENPRTLRLYDRLPAGDRRRLALSWRVYDLLVEERRYRDAVEALPFERMIQRFELAARQETVPSNIAYPERVRESLRRVAAARTAKDIEALAGAGDLANARTLARQLLAFDESTATRAVLETHLARAGRPELLSTP